MKVILKSEEVKISTIPSEVYKSVDLISIKNIIQGYTSGEYVSSKDYQKHLTETQIVIKSLRRHKPLYEIITDFFKYDYKKAPNWNNIKTRVGYDKSYIYEDFILRINPFSHVPDPIVFSKSLTSYYDMRYEDQINFRSIVKVLSKYIDDLTIAKLNNILQGIPLKTPVVWTAGQYSFDYFIKNQRLKKNYKKSIPHYFTFPYEPASVRDGGTNHSGKPYEKELEYVVKIISEFQ